MTFYLEVDADLYVCLLAVEEGDEGQRIETLDRVGGPYSTELQAANHRETLEVRYAGLYGADFHRTAKLLILTGDAMRADRRFERVIEECQDCGHGFTWNRSTDGDDPPACPNCGRFHSESDFAETVESAESV